MMAFNVIIKTLSMLKDFVTLRAAEWYNIIMSHRKGSFVWRSYGIRRQLTFCWS